MSAGWWCCAGLLQHRAGACSALLRASLAAPNTRACPPPACRLGALSGIAATLAFPPLHRRMGLVACGALSIWAQLACVLVAVAPAAAAALGAAVPRAVQLYCLVWGLVLSRCGLWGFDLAANMLIQETTAHAALGSVSGMQGSLQSLFQMVAYAAGVAAPATDTFVWLMAGSCGAVALAAALYTGWAVRARCGAALGVATGPSAIDA